MTPVVEFRNIVKTFGGVHAVENGKNVSRAMRESARQGFWGGATPPLGYRTIEVERRGFYPLTFPLTVGPGSVSIAITLGAKAQARSIEFSWTQSADAMRTVLEAAQAGTLVSGLV